MTSFSDTIENGPQCLSLQRLSTSSRRKWSDLPQFGLTFIGESCNPKPFVMHLVYYAHSYRKPDDELNEMFEELMVSEGMTPSIDPPSDRLNSAKPERHLRSTDGLLCVLPYRKGSSVTPRPRYLNISESDDGSQSRGYRRPQATCLPPQMPHRHPTVCGSPTV